MITIQGKGVSKGIVKGPVYYFRRSVPVLTRITAPDPGAEKLRFAAAQRSCVKQLTKLAECCRQGDEASALLGVHALLVEDEDLVACVMGLLDEGCSAEYAVKTAGERFSAMFSALEDEYMRARAADITDVSYRLLKNLTGTGPRAIRPKVPVILAADDLAPSETMGLDRSKILGIVTRGGSHTSHTAILARAMGIPAICGAGEELSHYQGRFCCMDGESGTLVIEPDSAVLMAMEEKQKQQHRQMQLLRRLREQEDVSPDGRRIGLFCNITSPEETAAVLENGGRGIGLFRTEFLYLSSSGLPGEEEQFEAYRAALSAMEGRRVIIRTLDVGADKRAAFFADRQEENPALGMRGIRACLERPEVLYTQLRALYRASVWGDLAIMFPMVTSLWEVRECRRICREVVARLEAEGIPCRRDTRIGIMIETPAAVLTAPELAREVDFFSVGTNDLTQYILACDRQAAGMDRFYDPRHPAVLRAVEMAVEAAHGAGIPIGICGELAAEAELLPAFLDMGVDTLSVSPESVLHLRAALRGVVT